MTGVVAVARAGVAVGGGVAVTGGVAVAREVAPSLHVPDEPAVLRSRWRAAVLDGETPSAVAGGDGGVADWLWTRWRVLEDAGIDREGLRAICRSYRREIWLWLEGDRTWAQCCSALIGRIGRRLSSFA